jgi:hypothetical protein
MREQSDGWQATAAGLSEDISNAEDEIERLRAELEQSRQDHLATFLELMAVRCG